MDKPKSTPGTPKEEVNPPVEPKGKTTPGTPKGKTTPGTPKGKVTPVQEVPFTPGKGAQGTPETRKPTVTPPGTPQEPTKAEKRAATTKLLTAVKANNLIKVKEALAEGADVNAKDKHGRKALIIAAWKGGTDIVKALLDKGADIDAKTNKGYTALMQATWNGHEDVVKVLLDKEADIDAKSTSNDTALDIANRYSRTKIKALLEATKAATAKLFTAVSANDLSQVNEALEAGASANARNKDGFTPLILAAGHGRTAIANALIDKGADIEARSRGSASKWTALMYAAYEGQTETVKALIAKGANVNAEEEVFGSTALTYATRQGHTKIVALLKAAGATG